MESIINLNVGGTLMATKKSTLMQCDYFKSKFERWDSNKEECIFVDWDPKLFRHLLNKLRNAAYVLPNDENIVLMCNYFGYCAEIGITITPYARHLSSISITRPYDDIELLQYTVDTNIDKILTLWIDFSVFIENIRIIDATESTILTIGRKHLNIYFKKESGMRKIFLEKLIDVGEIKIVVNFLVKHQKKDAERCIVLIVGNIN